VLRLDAFVRPEQVPGVCDALAALDGVRHVLAGAATTEGAVSVAAEVEPTAADLAIELLAHLGVDWRDVTISRTTSIRPIGWHHQRRSAGTDGHVWAEVVGRADDNAALAATYILYMIAAGVIAGVGVLTGSSILVVGAMAISPDLLPITASAIGLVDHRWHLAARAGRALVVGLGTGAAAACATTAVVRVVGRLPDDLILADTVLGPSLTQLGPGSVLVSIAAGVAGMLAFERAAGAAVGVAISVTTIPAAAYVGAAIALGRTTPMGGALVVLVTNVFFIVTASTATLWVQRARASRLRARREPTPPDRGSPSSPSAIS
jgi:uncharacterized hydrophobic protein (TIGR00271 family)